MNKGTEINSSKKLIEHLQLHFPKRLAGGRPELDVPPNTVIKKVFKDYTFSGHFGIIFRDCKFINCRFENLSGFFCLFANCSFRKTQFIDTSFSHFEEYWYGLDFEDCSFTRVRLDEGTFLNVVFDECRFESWDMGGLYAVENTWFRDCYMIGSQFSSLNYFNNEAYTPTEFPDIVFENCIIYNSAFTNNDLRYSSFVNTILFDTAFINCKLMTDSLVVDERLRHDSQATIDLQTILKSEAINPEVLKYYFNINDPDIKTVISKVTTKTAFKKVFISFSFKDERFANRLYQVLTANGIRPFFWMQDAPPGQPLEDIMASNVKSHDKILFIASKDSLKSPACQFELSEGRKKQAETWETIFFPIHIDDFLFRVNKNQIRPMEKADEYWANIEEIKRVNSIDFSAFNEDAIDEVKFSELVRRIATELQLN